MPGFDGILQQRIFHEILQHQWCKLGVHNCAKVGSSVDLMGKFEQTFRHRDNLEI